jgi:predicted nucleic-acid-binding Zn-ribbon protein
MQRTLSCPKCQGSMAIGYILDTSYGTQGAGQWVEGEPEKSFWTGIKVRGKTKRPIESWRCQRCGYLENYARF